MVLTMSPRVRSWRSGLPGGTRWGRLQHELALAALPGAGIVSTSPSR
jgi:hypothetical protein